VAKKAVLAEHMPHGEPARPSSGVVNEGYSRRFTTHVVRSLMMGHTQQMDEKIRDEVEGFHFETTEEDVKDAYADLKSKLTPMQMEKVVRRGITHINGNGEVLTDESIQFQFSLFDSDGNGVICRKDMEESIGKLGIKETEVQQMLEGLESADVDHDGQITFEEFEKMVRDVDRTDQTLIELLDMKARLSGYEKRIDDRAAKEIIEKRDELRAEIESKEKEVNDTQTGFGHIYQTAMARYKSSDSVYESLNQFIAFMCFDDSLEMRARMERAGVPVLVPIDRLLHPPRKYCSQPEQANGSNARAKAGSKMQWSMDVAMDEGHRRWAADQNNFERIFSGRQEPHSQHGQQHQPHPPPPGSSSSAVRGGSSPRKGSLKKTQQRVHHSVLHRVGPGIGEEGDGEEGQGVMAATSHLNNNVCTGGADGEGGGEGGGSSEVAVAARLKKVFLFYAALSDLYNSRMVTRSSFAKMAVDLGFERVFPAHVALSVFDACVDNTDPESSSDGGEQAASGAACRGAATTTVSASRMRRDQGSHARAVLNFTRWKQATLALAYLMQTNTREGHLSRHLSRARAVKAESHARAKNAIRKPRRERPSSAAPSSAALGVAVGVGSVFSEVQQAALFDTMVLPFVKSLMIQPLAEELRALSVQAGLKKRLWTMRQVFEHYCGLNIPEPSPCYIYDPPTLTSRSRSQSHHSRSSNKPTAMDIASFVTLLRNFDCLGGGGSALGLSRRWELQQKHECEQLDRHNGLPRPKPRPRSPRCTLTITNACEIFHAANFGAAADDDTSTITFGEFVEALLRVALTLYPLQEMHTVTPKVAFKNTPADVQRIAKILMQTNRFIWEVPDPHASSSTKKGKWCDASGSGGGLCESDSSGSDAAGRISGTPTLRKQQGGKRKSERPYEVRDFTSVTSNRPYEGTHARDSMSAKGMFETALQNIAPPTYPGLHDPGYSVDRLIFPGADSMLLEHQLEPIRHRERERIAT
jgi:Ca2+-binding EF-hand superfamily protein